MKARPGIALVVLFMIVPFVAAEAKGAGEAPPANRTVVELGDSTSHIDLGPLALVYEERTRAEAPSSLGFEPDRRLFRPVSGPADLNRGFTESAVWLAFTVRSAASERSWILAAGPIYTDSVLVYTVGPEGGTELQSAGLAQPGGRRGKSLSEFVFRLTIGPGEAKTVYIRYASEETLRIRANLWDSYDYIKASSVDSAFIGLALGIVLAVFVYTLSIVVSLRERAYVFYLVYLLGLLFYIVSVNGVGNAYIWPGNAWLGRRATPSFASLMMFGVILFARRYLDTKKRLPLLDPLLVALAGSVPFVLAGLLFLDYRFFMRIGGYLSIAGFLALFIAALFGALMRIRRAYIFLGAWTFALAGALTAQLGTLGFTSIYMEILWTKGEQLGALVQVILLAFGISDTVNAMRLEKEDGQRKSIELLERANKVKEEFLIATSMEFRSPLYAVSSLASRLGALIADRVGPEEKRLAALILAEAQRLLGSVANIAAYSRLRHGDIALLPERVSLREAIDGATGMAAHLAAGKEIAVEISADEEEVDADLRCLQQVVYNLFSEAIKRCAGGWIRIEGRVGEEGLSISVSDKGPAPNPELLSRAFAALGPEHPETLGPGLELLVTRLLVERMGGTLSYGRSGDLGRFELRLPRFARGPIYRSPRERLRERLRARGHATTPTIDLGETPEGQGARGRILVADEDPVYLEALKHHLEERGYGVTSLVSAEAAASMACAERRFDLVLLDATGPSRTGIAACERIRRSKPLGELPVVLMTDRESAEAVADAFRAGASDYLPKHSPTELLFARVDTQVALRRASEESVEAKRRSAEFEKLKTLGVLAAGVAHEINTPNNAVLRNTPIVSEVWKELAPIVRRLMEESGGFSIRGWSAEELLEELPALLEDTYGAGLQIRKIVEDLKDYARDSSASPPEDVDLSEVAAYAARLLAPLVARATRRFELDAPPGLPHVLANYQKLTQVAVNILENALQSLPGPEAGVLLRVRSDTLRGAVVLECADEGRGIAPALRTRVFEPFFTTKRESGGTGLGLSVALGIVREHGGEIEIESELGKGTVARVILHARNGPKKEETR